MEKRFLIAALLSFFVIFVWYTFVVPPQKLIKTTEVSSAPVVQNANTEEALLPDAQANDFIEETTALVTDQYRVTLSNKGGNIIKIELLPGNELLPINHLIGFSSADNLEFQLIQSTNDTKSFEYRDGNTYFKKDYRIDRDSGLLSVVVSGGGPSIEKEIRAYDLNMSILGDKNKIPNFHQEKTLFEYVVNSGKDIYRKAKAFEFKTDKNDHVISGLNQWVGYRDRYNCVIIKPEFSSELTKIKTMDKEHLGLSWDVSRETLNGQFKFSAVAYIGPENKEKLASYGLGFEDIKRFYNWVIFEWPAKFIYFLLHQIHRAIPVWGVCIILISLAVYFATYPLTMKSMVSMRKMQEVAPEIKAIQEKYKGNPQQLNNEMIAIYHRYNINPLSGCLPMLLQMPVFIGLYQVLWRDSSFKGDKFLWIKDLSQPDRLFTFSQNLPFIGHDFNILPLVMVVVMFFQQRLTMKTSIPLDETQAMQQKMMSYMMPVLLGFIFYHFSSGLTLYFVVFYVMSTLTQWKFSLNIGKKA